MVVARPCLVGRGTRRQLVGGLSRLRERLLDARAAGVARSDRMDLRWLVPDEGWRSFATDRQAARWADITAWPVPVGRFPHARARREMEFLQARPERGRPRPRRGWRPRSQG